jgi:uncharacterized protein YyaL (SSP411 family)/aryl-alcohol dehydrogenase-like predicted oxidoreductase
MRENRLARETSPYLLQHARNPVDWYPWGAEALARARAEDKPILLSIGYSACHWCHVMERESFEDEAIATQMNRDYVCIKVDREERPDLDEIYMKATVTMNHGHGGWPMTVFLTPDQRPFFAGTYFPPRDNYGRPGFPTVLSRIAEAWRDRRKDLDEQAARLTEHLQNEARASAPLPITEAELRLAVAQYRREFDPTYGGFGHAPKFPPSTGLLLLLRAHRRFGDPEALAMAVKTLDMMAGGGMYDQVGGGFHRYSTDERWLAPHFEKMLYDNALLARAYLEAHQVTGAARPRKIATEILDYVLAEMVDRDGGFHSATDADSEGVEGKFFVWDPVQVRDAVGDDETARRICAFYDISEEGNWEGHSIPNTPRAIDEVADDLGISVEELERSIASGRRAMYDARKKRIAPGLDDKVLTAWNGMMVSAFAEGYRVLGERRFLDAATRAAKFLTTTMRRPDGGLYRTFRAGTAHLDAYLEDYAWLCEALCDLYEAGGAPEWLETARALAERMVNDFLDGETGAFFTTAVEHEKLIVRHKEAMDGAVPSGNSVAAGVLARLSYHFGNGKLREMAVRAVAAYGKIVGRYPRAFARSLMVIDLVLEGATELAFVGAPEDPGRIALERAVAASYLPHRIVAHLDDPANPSKHPLLDGKTLVDGKAALYVCRDFACQAPITDPAALAAALGGPKKAPAPPAATPRFATAEATRAHTTPFAAHGTALLGSTGLTVAKIGFGGYRVDESDPDFAEALVSALTSGINLIDTSTNYTDGGSERMIGEVLADLTREGAFSREAIVVVSKVGYVQGSNLRLARQREAAGKPFPEMVKYQDSCWHCIHPEFLEDQLARSLGRLGLDGLDVLLLHNPEYFFADAEHRGGGEISALRDQFYARMREAFAFLEGQVKAGRIRWYGVSSNSCTDPEDDRESTSLLRMLDAAKSAGGDGHHFRVLQLPMNLLESGGALVENNRGKTVLACAADNGIGVLVNRPLNAIRGRGMVRLAKAVPGSEGMDPKRQAATVEWAGAILDPLLPAERRNAALQQKALATLTSTAGVSCVLLGMRRPLYVKDARAVLSAAPLADPVSVYRAFGRAFAETP